MWDKLRDWWWPKPKPRTWRDKVRDSVDLVLGVAALAAFCVVLVTIWWIHASLKVLADNTIESAVVAFWGALWRWIRG